MEHQYLCRQCLEEEWKRQQFYQSPNIKKEYHEAPILENNEHNKEQPIIKKQLQNYYKQEIDEQIKQKQLLKQNKKILH
jgi:hypothetical protein